MEIFTIGYEGLSQIDFLKYLKHHKINLIADVRHLPLSRKKGFSKSSLGETLNKRNIEYKNHRGLGTSKQMRNMLNTTGDYKIFFNEYKKEIRCKSENIIDLYKILVAGKRVALLCYERDAKKCHRSVVADEIKKLNGNGLKITHIKPI